MTKLVPNKIIVRGRNRKAFFLDPSEIERIVTRSYLKSTAEGASCGDSKITYVFTPCGMKIVTHQLIKQWEQQLEPYRVFLRVRQSCIINKDQIKSVDLSDSAMRIELASGTIIDVSRGYLDDVKKALSL